MFKVSLINPPERILSGGFKYYVPFPLLYLASHLESNGVKTDIVDIKIAKTYIEAIKIRAFDYYNLIAKKKTVVEGALNDLIIDKIIEKIIASLPSLIGISCITKEYNSVMKIASILKKKVGAPIVVGGIHPSLFPEQFIFDGSPVDFIVIGEGEDALLELARRIESGKGDYSNIDGIAYLNKKRCFITEARALKEDFSISPILAYSKLDMQFYTQLHSYVVRYVRLSGTQIFTSRGCPYKCTFCSNSLIWKMNKGYRGIRYRPIKSVIEEIVFLRDRYHIDAFYIMDDTFCIDKRRVEEFCGELKNANVNLVWAAETRSNLVDEGLLKKMKSEGLVQLDIGVESGSDKMLKEIMKGVTVQDTENIFSLARRYGIRTFANIMVNLPNETLGDLQETINLLDKIRPSSGGIAVTVPLPKTELFNKYIAPKMDRDYEITEIISRHSNYYKITDSRFHLCDYNIEFEELTNRLVFKHFLFTELQLGFWYWKIFMRSKKKGKYFFTIIHYITFLSLWQAYG